MTHFPYIRVGLLLLLILGFLLLRRASLEGKVILVFAVLALGAFIRLKFYLLLFTSLALATFVIVALIWAWIASSRLRLERNIKKEALVGENVPVNYKALTLAFLPLYHVRVWDRAYREHADASAEEHTFSEPGYVSFLRLKAGELSEGMQHIIPSVRGVHKFGPVAIEGGDPFGMFTFYRWLPIADECLVLPTWVRLAALPSVPARFGEKKQEHLVPREGQSHEFLGTRAYSEGDSLRHVHWPLTARHDTLVVRQFQREVEEEMLIILDADRESDIGEGAENAFEYLITLSLSLINAASELGRPWTFVIVADETIMLSHMSREALLATQYALARLQAKRDDPIEAYLDDLRRQYLSAACLLLTARTDSGPAAVLARGDSQSGDGTQSTIIRVDPSSFMTVADGRLKKLKKQRSESEHHEPVVGIPELRVSRGDNIADLFLTTAPT